MIKVGIITAPRATPTIDRSITSFRAAGFKQEVSIFAEPGSELPVCDGCVVVQNEVRRGNFKNWVNALRTLALTGSQWLMVCEDDIVWAHDAAATLEHDLNTWVWKSSKAGALSLFFPIRMSKVLENKYGAPLVQGWYGMNLGRSTWGAQCLVFHMSWAVALLNDSALREFVDNPRWDKNVDALIADVLIRRGREIMYRVPCLVDHTLGEGNSSLGYKPNRPDLKTRYFQGEAKDWV